MFDGERCNLKADWLSHIEEGVALFYFMDPSQNIFFIK